MRCQHVQAERDEPREAVDLGEVRQEEPERAVGVIPAENHHEALGVRGESARARGPQAARRDLAKQRILRGAEITRTHRTKDRVERPLLFEVRRIERGRLVRAALEALRHHAGVPCPSGVRERFGARRLLRPSFEARRERAPRAA